MNLMKQIIELIQVAIGVREEMSQIPSDAEWECLLNESLSKGLIGITYVSVKKLARQPGYTLPKKVLLNWGGNVVQLKDQNTHVSAQGERVLKYFREANFQAIILKGQSHLPNYPEELRELRSPGDIDVWVRGESKRQVYQFVRKVSPDEDYGYLHISFPAYSDLSVEIHIRPAFLCNPFRNRRLQQWADGIDLATLSDIDRFRDFNAIYQPLHLYKHLMREGITLRQLIDYYFLLKQHPYTDEDILRQFGIDGFCNDLQSVVMYLFENVPIASTSARKLLKEVMIDISVAGTNDDDELKRTLRVIRLYPNDILWRPYFWLFQKFWKRFN